MKPSEIARQLLDSTLLETIQDRLLMNIYADFTDGLRAKDGTGENPYPLALAAARRREAVEDVIGEIMKIAREAEK